MSTAIDIGVMSPDSVSNADPNQGIITSNLTPDGTQNPVNTPQGFNVFVPGTSPQGGIDYIDQAVGGATGVRLDALSSVVGMRSYRSRTQPFNGDFIGQRMTMVPNRVQGEVGRQRNTTIQRSVSAAATNIPDRGDVLAGFTNPALSAVLRMFRRDA